MHNPLTIFITGSGRSGTNITKAIFEKHSQCATLPFEYRFTVDPGGIIDFVNQYSGTWSPFMADKRLRNLEQFLMSLAERDENEYPVSNWLKKMDKRAENITPHAYADWELGKVMPGYEKRVKELIKQLTDYRYKASWPGADSLSTNNEMYFGKPKTKEELTSIFSKFLEDCFQSILSDTNKEIFVEDNTWSFLFAKDLLDLVPNGKILHIVRDPRDVVASLIKQRWTPSELGQILVWYKSVMSTWEDQKSMLDQEKFKEIRLEDLIQDPQKIMQATCSFLGLAYEREMTNIDLSKSNSGRYRAEFTEDQIAHINDELEDIIARYGYV